jgi:2-methylcitrate dehydratase PrpD
MITKVNKRERRVEKTSTGRLAALAIETPAEAIPPDACDTACDLVLDAVGVAHAGWQAPGVEQTLDLVRESGGSGVATVLAHGDWLPMPQAAFANGVLIHALDYDDLYMPASLHLTSCVLPAAMAAAQASGSTGREFLAALVLGIEVAARLGTALEGRWDHVQRAGLLQTTIIGGFGATVAACRLLGLNTGETRDALGIYHARNAGNRQALYDKTLTKRLQPGFAARDALWAAGLAQRGISGPGRAIEGEAGLMQVHARVEDVPDLRRLDAARDRWAVQDVWIKRFPSCGACHQVTQAGLDLAGERDWRRGYIEEAWIYLGEGGNRMVGAPFERRRNPQADAQFSATYGASVALLRGRAGPREYAPERIREDEEVARLAAGMRVVEHLENPPAMRGPDDGMPAFADTPHRLHVRTRDGREHEATSTLREVILPVGPARREAIIGKFHDCTACSVLYSRRQSAALADQIYALPDADTIDALFPSPE